MFQKTPQEWFNGAWERAKNPHHSYVDGSCVYREEGGPGCFIGCQVPPDVTLREGASASALCGDGVIGVIGGVKDGGSGDVRWLLSDIQYVHDSTWDGSTDQWAEKLRQVASKYGLAVPE